MTDLHLQIKDLPEQTTSVTTDKVPMQDVSNTTKYFTLTTLATFLRTLFPYKTSDYTIMKSTEAAGVKLDESSPALAWDDLKGVHYMDNSGVNAPTFETFATGIEILGFNATDKCRTELHISHNDVVGGDKFIHPHVRMADGASASGNLVLTHVVRHSMHSIGATETRGTNPAPMTFTQTITAAQLNAIGSGKNQPFDVQIASTAGSASLLASNIMLVDDIINITTTVTTLPTITGGTTSKIGILPIDGHREVNGKPGTKYKDRVLGSGSFNGTT